MQMLRISGLANRLDVDERRRDEAAGGATEAREAPIVEVLVVSYYEQGRL